ncbi:hypothetical protein [uncultured Amaricoccus sp.]|mgnify:FL=1|uniref:hypothetical protein n=1 Tax=uncultured Amaricoccus sp. TaxID=339341 RepID=UPI002603F6E7|nr:hypothetical protein [uncultured Amaricoccus sp.]
MRDEGASAREAPASPGRLVGMGLGCLVLAGCGVKVPSVDLPGAGWGNEGREALFENRVWLDQGADAPAGDLRIFLSDGTLVMTSCGEVYRLAPWRWIDEGTLVWEEDGKSIRADVAVIERREMALVIDPDGLNAGREYRAAEAPVVCPDRR